MEHRKDLETTLASKSTKDHREGMPTWHACDDEPSLIQSGYGGSAPPLSVEPAQPSRASPLPMIHVSPFTNVSSQSNTEHAFARLNPSHASLRLASHFPFQPACTSAPCIPDQRRRPMVARGLSSQHVDADLLSSSPVSLGLFNELATPPIPGTLPPRGLSSRFSGAGQVADHDMLRLASDLRSGTRSPCTRSSASMRSHASPSHPTIGNLVRDYKFADGHVSKKLQLEPTETLSPLVRPTRRASLSGTLTRKPHPCTTFLGASTPATTTLENRDEFSMVILNESVRSKMDEILFSFFEKLCSNMDATDAGGERIHQTLMAKKMQRLDESLDYKPFKFRIQAFTNRFIEELAERGLREPDWPQKLVGRMPLY
jgi:hypothetical protein